jgi:hypothetical protein
MAWGTPEVVSLLYGAGLAVQTWYGLWLNKVVKQKEELLNGQLSTKNATIEMLNTVIKAKDVQIRNLQDDTAPAIVANYNVVKDYADKISEEVLKLKTASRKEPAKAEMGEQKIPLSMRRYQLNGLQIAISVFAKRLRDAPNLFPNSYRNQSYSAADLLAIMKLILEDLTSKASDILSTSEKDQDKSLTDKS